MFEPSIQPRYSRCSKGTRCFCSVLQLKVQCVGFSGMEWCGCPHVSPSPTVAGRNLKGPLFGRAPPGLHDKDDRLCGRGLTPSADLTDDS